MTSHTQALLLLLALLPSTSNADNISPYIEFDSFLLSEPIALDAINKNWNADYHPHGENQIASIWLESGVKKGDWSYGALLREEYQLNFSTDTADLYYNTANNKDLPLNQDYQLDLDAYRFRGRGIRISKHVITNNKFEFRLGSSLFYASHLLSGGLSGFANANSINKYTYNFGVDYQYDEDVLTGRKGTTPPDGIGLAIDTEVKWKPTEKLQVNANIKDLVGAIYWKNAPYTKAVANSNTVTIDGNGFTHVNPVLTGIEGYRSSYTQQLKPSVNLSAEYSINTSPYSITLQGKHSGNLSLFSVGGSKKTGRGKVSLHYWPTIKTIEAYYRLKNIGLSVGLDDLNFSDTRAFWLTIKYQ
ncbi:MAG: hypothetical protein CSB47_03305 [Proteobacteria bacterium]|nr:MAG: hypothetical protein CSB47_03305 [Pseudomonadota bacterium]